MLIYSLLLACLLACLARSMGLWRGVLTGQVFFFFFSTASDGYTDVEYVVLKTE